MDDANKAPNYNSFKVKKIIRKSINVKNSRAVSNL